LKPFFETLSLLHQARSEESACQKLNVQFFKSLILSLMSWDGEKNHLSLLPFNVEIILYSPEFPLVSPYGDLAQRKTDY
jgi:hypothetical protein